MSRLIGPLLVLVVWLALWGEVNVINVVSGVAVGVAVQIAFREGRERHRVHLVGLAKLVAVFAWRLVTSSANVVVTVLAPTPDRLRSGVVGVELTQSSPLVATIVADAISLTPGTLTLDSRFPAPDAGAGALPVLYIHVLGLEDPEAIRDDVHGLERLVLSAVTPSATEAGGTT
ncbi:MAG: Na+/H+ antiporter subunit E [Actinomycetota bacterium]